VSSAPADPALSEEGVQAAPNQPPVGCPILHAAGEQLHGPAAHPHLVPDRRDPTLVGGLFVDVSDASHESSNGGLHRRQLADGADPVAPRRGLVPIRRSFAARRSPQLSRTKLPAARNPPAAQFTPPARPSRVQSRDTAIHVVAPQPPPQPYGPPPFVLQQTLEEKVMSPGPQALAVTVQRRHCGADDDRWQANRSGSGRPRRHRYCRRRSGPTWGSAKA
jgi:hypothetical protein